MTWTKPIKTKLILEKEDIFLGKNIFSIARDAALIITFALLTGISAHIKIELGPVPITLQTLVVMISPVLLGKERGFLSQAVYLLGGLWGLPWFSRGGGVSYIISPTFGYLLGFIPASFFIGSWIEKQKTTKIKNIILIMGVGNLIIYITGLVWLTNFVPASALLEIGLYPFLAGDLIKLVSASMIINSKQKSFSQGRES
ncbi:MAG: biotin transporter BioY [Candidatus Nealsonbacteria bacterium]|nr:biotin transporter BioY [Candidatus Nealsonbacteria bacterium]